MPEKPTEIERNPTPEDIYIALMKLLPKGRAWGDIDDNIDRDTVQKKFMYAIGNVWAKYEAAMNAALDEWFCYSSTTDIDGWRQDYGIPDECDMYNANVCSKVQTGNQPTAEFLMARLAENGYVGQGRWLKSNDEEFPGSRATFYVVIDPMLSPAYIDYGTTLEFTLDEDSTLGAPSLGQPICMLERYIPAHAAVLGHVSGTFDPIETLGPKLLAWWNADDITATPFITWTDRIGGLIASVIGANPQPITEVLDGSKYATFSAAANEYLEITTPAGLITGATDGSIFASVIPRIADATAGVQHIIGYGDATEGRGLARAQSTTSRFSARNDKSGDVQLVDGSQPFFSDVADNDLFVIMGRFIGTAIQGRINGAVTSPSQSTVSTLATTNSRLRIGGPYMPEPYVSGNEFAGNIRNIMIATNLSQHERMRLEAWLAWDSGRQDILPPTHPYRFMRP